MEEQPKPSLDEVIRGLVAQEIEGQEERIAARVTAAVRDVLEGTERLRLVFSISEDLMLGKEKVLKAEIKLREGFDRSHVRRFRPERMTANVPSPGFVILEKVLFRGENILLCDKIDAWMWNANAVGQHIKAIECSPDDTASFEGFYTGRSCAPLPESGTFKFILSATGPAVVAVEEGK